MFCSKKTHEKRNQVLLPKIHSFFSSSSSSQNSLFSFPKFLFFLSKAKKSSSSSSQNPKQQHEKHLSSSNTCKSIFTLNDEILILNRFLDFESQTGQNIMTDYTPFYNSFKELLSLKPTQKQLRKRIWKLKQKY